MASMLAALASDDAASLTTPLRIGDDEDTRFEQVFGLILGANRHLGERRARSAFLAPQDLALEAVALRALCDLLAYLE